MQATAVVAPGARPATIADGDVVVFMNFRADRARQMTRALTDPAFAGFPRSRVPRLAAYVCLTSYGDEFAALPVAFAPQTIRNGFGEYVASLGLTQLRIAETEKYAHVTYFFNGGVEDVYPGEDRILVPSPKVATYDLKPEMSAVEVTDRLVAAIASRKYDAIVCNYANGDMVGHTGNFDAAKKAVETLDACIGRVVAAARAVGGEVLITADHGNAETMFDPATGQPHTAHTLQPRAVPLRRPAGHGRRRRRAAGPRADDAGADGPAAAARDDRALAGPPGARLTPRCPGPADAGRGTCGAGRGPSRTLDAVRLRKGPRDAAGRLNKAGWPARGAARWRAYTFLAGRAAGMAAQGGGSPARGGRRVLRRNGSDGQWQRKKRASATAGRRPG